MRALAGLAAIAACSPTGSAVRVVAPGTALPTAETTLVKADMVPCGVPDVSPPAPARCGPNILATGSGLIQRVWQAPCAVTGLELFGDGGVGYFASTGPYHIDDRQQIHADSRQLSATAVAGTTRYQILTAGDGSAVLAHDGRCERIPLMPAPWGFAAVADGSLVTWALDPDRGVRWLERTRGGDWRASAALPDLALGLYAQGGHAVAGYTRQQPAEIGFFDAALHPHPIRRTAGVRLIGLLAADDPDEPPVALDNIDNRLAIEQPDRELGFRRLELELTPAVSCTNADGYGPMPSGSFAHHTSPVLFRAGGDVWVAYGEWTGQCHYVKTGSRGRISPFLLAHPAPLPPRWSPTEEVWHTELVIVPVERGHLGQPVHAQLAPHRLDFAAAVDVEPARIRLLLGDLIVEVDPDRLARAR